jgi:hypothetical protein
MLLVKQWFDVSLSDSKFVRGWRWHFDSFFKFCQILGDDEFYVPGSRMGMVPHEKIVGVMVNVGYPQCEGFLRADGLRYRDSEQQPNLDCC